MHDEPAVQCISDDDLYKFTMQQGYLELFPKVQSTSEFTNRRPTDVFNERFLGALREEVNHWEKLRLYDWEADFFQGMGFFKPSYIEWLRNFRYNRDAIDIKLQDGRLSIRISGDLPFQTAHEVKLMAAISELYFRHCDTDWDYVDQEALAASKAFALASAGCVCTDFGTRRRRSFQSQNWVVGIMAASDAAKKGYFVGTSNVCLAQKYGVKAIGTVAHEWFMAHSALMGLRHANRYGMDGWTKVYGGNLGTALTDTYGTDAFLKDFDSVHARLWDGVRQDSGDPFAYVDKIVAHYKTMRIDPMHKYIVFSNSLDLETAIKLQHYCEGKILARFGIGTFFTNDFRKASDRSVVSKALNMVIKLRTINGIEVVKLSDDVDKATGARDAVRIAKYIHRGIPLDAAA